jgi:hypothetical protein
VSRFSRLGSAYAAILLAGCSLTIPVEIYNNTGRAIEVMTGDHRSVVDPGETKRVSLTGERDTLVLGRICLDHSLLRYSVDALPHGDPKPAAFSQRVRVQVDSDQRMRILAADDEFPLAPDRPQPEHYPLNPEREGDC